MPEPKRRGEIIYVLILAAIFLGAAISTAISKVHEKGLGHGLSYGVGLIGVVIMALGSLTKQRALIKWGFLIAALGGIINISIALF